MIHYWTTPGYWTGTRFFYIPCEPKHIKIDKEKDVLKKIEDEINKEIAKETVTEEEWFDETTGNCFKKVITTVKDGKKTVEEYHGEKLIKKTVTNG